MAGAAARHDDTAAGTRDPRIPVVVVTGFLGAGKTTLLRQVLADPAMAHSLLVVNEIGEIGIDHHLLEQSDDRTVLMDNGCVCCQWRGDLQELLVDTMMKRRRGALPPFDRVLIETSGLADPGPVAQTLYGDRPLARDYRLAHVVTLVDPTNAAARDAAAEIATRQLAAADLVVLSKHDRATPAQLQAARTWIDRVNGAARVQTAEHGRTDLQVLVRPTPVLAREAAPSADDEGSYLGRHLVPHPHDVGSFVLRLPEPVPRELFALFLQTLVRLRGPDLLRVKGFVRYQQAVAPVLVQGVCHVFDAEVDLTTRQTLPPGSALVFIARGLVLDHVQALWQSLAALSVPALPSSTLPGASP